MDYTNIEGKLVKNIRDCTLVDYVWIGGSGELRSKTKVLYDVTGSSLKDIPIWNYDGSSTGQASGSDSEIFIKPQRIFKDPFRRPNDIIVMCDTYKYENKILVPHETNHRYDAEKIFQKYTDEKPWFGLEQEYFIYDCVTHMPVGFVNGMEQGPYYCSTGGNNAFCRQISDEHMMACLYTGITLSGTNAEVAPAQWEYQNGIVEGLDVADQLWISRYILQKISEKYDKYIVFDPKPLPDYNGSGCHTNVSIQKMREEGGLDVIYKAIEKLEKNHKELIKFCGEDNRKRLIGKHETSSYDKFTWGIADRTASVRIPTETAMNERGYLEYRVPASNMDPYLVTSKILETIME